MVYLQKQSDGERGEAFGLDELVARANRLLPGYLPDDVIDGRVRDAVNPRLVRHLTTLGLLDEAGREGREARYTSRHLLQLLVARRLMAEGYTTGAIKKLTAGADDATLDQLLQRGAAMLGHGESTHAAASTHALKVEEPSESRAAPRMARRSKAPMSTKESSSTKAQTGNAALDYLQTIRDSKAPRAAPTTAPDATRWTRVEIAPELELHVGEHFRAPPTPHERDELLGRIEEHLKNLAKSRSRRHTP